MSQINFELLQSNGWTVECESPFEIRHEDGSFATGAAAFLVMHTLEEAFIDPYIELQNTIASYIQEYEEQTGEVVGCFLTLESQGSEENEQLSSKLLEFNGQEFVDSSAMIVQQS